MTMRWILFFCWFIPLSVIAQNNQYSILPIQFYTGVPFVPVTINGVKTQLYVDLGGGGTYVSLSQAILNEAHTGEGKVTGYFTNWKGEHLPKIEYTLKQLTIGQYTIDHLPATQFATIRPFTNDTSRVSPLLNNGIIGLELLKKFSLIIDYQGNKIILFHGPLPIEYVNIPWKKFSFESGPSGVIITRSVINHTPVRVLWDTGNNYSTMKPEVASFAGLFSTCPANLMPEDLNCHLVKTPDFVVDNQDMGSQTFYVLPTQLPNMDASLGGNFFKEHIVWIDFDKKIIGVK